MAKSRSIRRGFIDSEKVNTLSWEAECTFHRLLLVADDYGVFDARPKYLLTQLFGMKMEAVSLESLKRSLQECERSGLIRLYSIDGKPYLHIRNYGQRVLKKTSDYPSPPPEEEEPPTETPPDEAPPQDETHGEPPKTTENHGEPPWNSENHGGIQKTTVEFGKPPWISENHGGVEPEVTLITRPTVEEKRREVEVEDEGEGKVEGEEKKKSEVEEKGRRREAEAPVTTTPRDTSPAPYAQHPPLPADIARVMQGLLLPPLQGSTLRECTVRFYDACTSTGWRDKYGNPLRDWKPAARNYARRYAENLAQRSRNTNPGARKDCNDATDYA